MYEIRNNEMLVSQLAQYVNKTFIGEDYLIYKPNSDINLIDNSFFFLENTVLDENTEQSLIGAIITTREIYEKVHNELKTTFIISEEPRLDFYRILKEFFIIRHSNTIHTTATIADTATVGFNVNIGRNSIICKNAKIGNNVFISDNVIIGPNSEIGSNCVIKQGAIIGTDSFEFLLDDEFVIDIPQFGNVVLGNSVLIGANTTIERSNFGTTNLEDYVKIDDGVNIGQDCIIKERTQIASGTVLAKDVRIGARCAIGINTSIRDHIIIADDVKIGMSSVVVNNLMEEGLYYGVPARKRK